jgi:LysR family transcriptional regulator, low CO2-responsive transcriptional regulator
MELRLLRTFVAVAELRHFAKAAEVCHLSQPAVSHQIALLEGEVGTPLFNRAGRRVTTTLAGDVLLEEARRILGAAERAHERVQQVARGTVGRVRLGATQTPGLYLLPPLLARYRRRHPGYEVHFGIHPVRDLCAMVEQNALDMAVVAGSAPRGELQARPLRRDAMIAVAPPDAPASGRARVDPPALAGECWILREQGSETRRLVTAWLERCGIVPARTMTLEGPDAVKRAVIAGLGVALVARRTVQEEIAAGRLAVLKVGAPLPQCDVWLVDHPRKHHGAACRAMRAMLAGD